MKTITNISELKEAIQQLENKQSNNWLLLKDQFLITSENLRPINLVKNALGELTDIPDLKNKLINTSISMVSGYLSKKLAFENTNNPIKQLLGNFLQMGISKIVSKAAEI